jgi:hypothetical protein
MMTMVRASITATQREIMQRKADRRPIEDRWQELVSGGQIEAARGSGSAFDLKRLLAE